MNRPCTYLRVLLTARCNLSCPYCHREGLSGRCGELPAQGLLEVLGVAVAAGVQKFKLLGGEPFLRPDLPRIVRGLRKLSPDADISVITGGVVPASRLDEVYAAGLDRVNVSIHGFRARAMLSRTRFRGAHRRRREFLNSALARGRPMKLNYVFRAGEDDEDLGELLEWAARLPNVVVGVLDDLGGPGGWKSVADAIVRLRGEPVEKWRDEDPHSLDAARWRFSDGLVVELKDRELGAVAPFALCATCPKRAGCREGTFALRLTPDGKLMPCMLRSDRAAPIAEIVRAQGAEAALAAWRRAGEVAP